MPKYLVTRVVAFTKVIEAPDKATAIAEFYDFESDAETLKTTAKLIKEGGTENGN